MYFVYAVFILSCFSFLDYVFVGSQGNENSSENGDEGVQEKPLVDHHTFVALIDIVFTDGSKRTCTGTIIHDIVVITAAHCFTVKDNAFIQPELTASFVVIGTKKMFDSGYEQYLPIERVLTHPKFKGWTADLALVYTFAGMTSDKPGTVIPLAGEKTSTPVDSNVTVFSWGHSGDDDLLNTNEKTKSPDKSEDPCPDSSSEELQSQDFNKDKVTAPLRKSRISSDQKVPDLLRSNTRQEQQNIQNLKIQYNPHIQKMQSRVKLRQSKKKSQQLYSAKKDKSKKISRYLAVGEEDKNIELQYDLRRHKAKLHRNKTVRNGTKEDFISASQILLRHGLHVPRMERRRINNFKSHYRNWRRQMGSQHNKLIVEMFGFVNMHTCKKLIEKAMPALYEIKDGHDVLCYTSEEHYITDADSGAPAIRHGKLVAVTVGGAECDGDHVAVGMKMSCYCSWIANNLPGGGYQMNCCKNCCGMADKEDKTNMKHKNKYLLK